jgi:hypothetical protein
LTIWPGEDAQTGMEVVELVGATTKCFTFRLLGGDLKICAVKSFSRAACNNVVEDHLQEQTLSGETKINFKKLSSK